MLSNKQLLNCKTQVIVYVCKQIRYKCIKGYSFIAKMVNDMKICKLYYSNSKLCDAELINNDNLDLPIYIKNKIHYLSTQVKKVHNAGKEAEFYEFIYLIQEFAKEFLYDVYIDNESLNDTGIVKIVSNNIVLHDLVSFKESSNLLSMLNAADEVVVESFNSGNSPDLVSMTVTYYLYDLVK